MCAESCRLLLWLRRQRLQPLRPWSTMAAFRFGSDQTCEEGMLLHRASGRGRDNADTALASPLITASCQACAHMQAASAAQVQANQPWDAHLEDTRSQSVIYIFS